MRRSCAIRFDGGTPCVSSDACSAARRGDAEALDLDPRQQAGEQPEIAIGRLDAGEHLIEAALPDDGDRGLGKQPEDQPADRDLLRERQRGERHRDCAAGDQRERDGACESNRAAASAQAASAPVRLTAVSAASTARSSRKSTLRRSSSTACWRATDFGDRAPALSHAASVASPASVRAVFSSSKSDARPKRSRSRAYG